MDFQSHLTLRHLRVVKVIGRELSLSRAAEVLNTSQPAISRALSEVETMLNARLFDRSTRKVSPTAIGRNLIWHAPSQCPLGCANLGQCSRSLGLRRCGDATLSKGLPVQRLLGHSSRRRSGQPFLWSAF